MAEGFGRNPYDTWSKWMPLRRYLLLCYSTWMLFYMPEYSLRGVPLLLTSLSMGRIADFDFGKARCNLAMKLNGPVGLDPVLQKESPRQNRRQKSWKLKRWRWRKNVRAWKANWCLGSQIRCSSQRHQGTAREPVVAWNVEEHLGHDTGRRCVASHDVKVRSTRSAYASKSI